MNYNHLRVIFIHRYHPDWASDAVVQCRVHEQGKALAYAPNFDNEQMVLIINKTLEEATECLIFALEKVAFRFEYYF